jgi:hypothetical protein
MMKCSECGNIFPEEEAKKHVDRHGYNYTFDEVTRVSPCCQESYREYNDADEYDYCRDCGMIDGCICGVKKNQHRQQVINALFPKPVQAALIALGVRL